ncbi:MAG: 1-(5-phosphoribosyl)-5-[(5-phosphoribosylamino)methylideneamino]imidazole-4-carboxamide isomerase [Defluviitaleaceae bacterium]|nr:1-(5-phosphoribosyl)-5-[(5-phosphoribosylamino)methylideneamino]imidazole-4-carboxamide isomerase [Defluviitaleaceae bacterium]
MKLFPAIDIQDKQAVRLSQGDFNQKTVYHTNPLEVAKQWQAAGSEWLHVVDLDGAKDGVSKNVEITREIISQTDLKVQLGGGIRSADHVKDWIVAGLDRVIIGSAAVGNLPFVAALVQAYGEKICIGVDAKNGKVATHGWLTDSGVDAFEFCQQLEKVGVQTVVYTDIAKDGMMQGPNFEAYEKLVRETNLQIIASGGVSRLEDLTRLAEIGVYGAILGKSLYEGAFTLEEAIACLQEG